MMTCIELALTAQLFCYSDHSFVCTDNGSLAKLIGVSACTGPGQRRVLKQFPAYLNRWDSQQARNEGVSGH
jgi:hypothetical protein